MSILSNIFLLVISILKLLSSSYIPIIIISFIIISIILYLSKRKLILPCFKCDNGGWWYKCKESTGFGSRDCDNHRYLIDQGVQAYNFIIDIPNKFEKILKRILEHNRNLIIKWVIFMKNITIIVLKLNPGYFIYKFLIEPFVKLIFNIFSKLIKEIKKLSFGFVIPVLDIDINIGEIISTPLTYLLDVVKLIFNTLINIFQSFAKFIYKQIIGPIINKISKVIKIVTKTILTILGILRKELNVLFNQIEYTINTIKIIKPKHIFMLVIDNIMNWTVNTILFPLRNLPYGIGEIIIYIMENSYVLLYIVMFILFIVLILPLLGIIWGLLSHIRALLYMILGCDNNNDFIILIYDILDNYFDFSKYIKKDDGE